MQIPVGGPGQHPSVRVKKIRHDIYARRYIVEEIFDSRQLKRLRAEKLPELMVVASTSKSMVMDATVLYLAVKVCSPNITLISSQALPHHAACQAFHRHSLQGVRSEGVQVPTGIDYQADDGGRKKAILRTPGAESDVNIELLRLSSGDREVAAENDGPGGEDVQAHAEPFTCEYPGDSTS